MSACVADVFEPFAPPPRPAMLDPSADQLAAAAAISAWIAPLIKLRKSTPRRLGDRSCPLQKQLLTLGGFAGTGKTTLIGHEAWSWLYEHGLRVAFATYTGKASTVLERSLARSGVRPDYIGTIHRLVYQPDTDDDGGIRGWRKADDLPFDVLVVDEASMVPTLVLSDLLSYGVPILAVGDHGQLPPVGEDAGVMAKPDIRLERIHRQAAGNPIIAIASAIREGASQRKILEAVEAAGDHRVRHLNGQAGLVEALKLTSDPSSSFLITYTNATRMNMNALARTVRGLDPKSQPVKGESVICLRNNYNDGERFPKAREDRSGRIIANGMRGIITGDVGPSDPKGHWLAAAVRFDDGNESTVDMLASQFNRLTFGNYGDIREAGGPRLYSWDDVGLLCDFGYAITCHKSQGSQAERVVVYLENALGKMQDDERRRWWYTAATRASAELLLVTP